MGKTNKYLGFIALAVLIGFVISGCLSLSDAPKGSASTKAGGSSASARAAGGSSSSVQAAGGSSSAQTGGPLHLSAAGQKRLSKFTGFFEKNWLSLLIILIICIVCAAICLTVKRKVKKPLIRNIIIASVVLASFGVIFFGVLRSGITRNSGNIQHKLEQTLKSTVSKNNPAKKTYARVDANRLNFRSGPSLSSRVIRGLPRNARVEVIHGLGTWWKVKYENTEGYLNSKYLRKE